MREVSIYNNWTDSGFPFILAAWKKRMDKIGVDGDIILRGYMKDKHSKVFVVILI